MIPSPYLVYLGAAKDPLSIKTSRGVAEWRRELCVGERRLPGCEVTLGLENLTYEEAVRRGAKTLILGEANAGGILTQTSVREAVAALEAGELPLERALALYEEGMTVAAACQRLLDEAALRVQELQSGAGLRLGAEE